MRRLEVATRRYGHALFDAAKSVNKLDSYLNELGEVSKVFSENEELKEFLKHPNIAVSEKKKVVRNILEGRIEPEIQNLIDVLIDHNRIDQIRVVYYDYKYLVYEEKGIKIAYVETAVKMTDYEIEELRKKLSKKYSKEIEIQNTIEPSIIGGIYLRIGDQVIDGTVRGRLEGMKKQLLEKGREVEV